MSMCDDGGPVFPVNYDHQTFQPKTTDEARRLMTGISLRDHFAGQALIGLLSNPKLQPEILKQGGAHGGWIETSAYAWADAMLQARKKKDPS